MKKIVSIGSGIALCLLVGWVSRLLHAEAMEVWYPTLEKSSLNPPDLVFPIVWGTLYVLLGISVGLLYCTQVYPQRNRLLGLFALQLLLNISWNYLFFYLRSPLPGLINLLVLDVLAVLYFMGTLRINKLSAWLFLPYTVWIIFASYLNFYILMHN